ncbi:16S rRNA (guanine(527)-N(7))-methyltransferase RsmG [Xylocopilactobacillus apicola]|uniref:Ribosomal RNA small subunit methyltransferase G n=1 Tax=Xylocopilactobacillus apicola TaxID=2932184 RepID=A0AAU9D9G9_9LACO|nr:16S rRNA (guanine(527)-N(7))-methyltransferase RsmG [Xylocopilactobacillus apicola]BDR59000.1 ribosomal RNA small subunit methyltransferase G [Xylocopilactobacillus apicola]
MDPDELETILKQMPGLDVQAAMQQFSFYYQELIETNQKYNLTRITDQKEAYLKHFYDSIIPALQWGSTVFRPEMKICDVGTGAGFPGIPLKIIYPDVKLSLLDSSQKKLQFLKNLSAQMHLTDVDFVWQRAEEFGQARGRAEFDLVVSRAVANLRMLSEYCLPLVKTNGYFLAYKGKNGHQELSEAQDLISLLGGQVQEELDLDLLDNDDFRTLFLIKKIKPTPKKYPRSNSQIKADMKGTHAK